MHQPLHAADDHDARRNSKRISAGGLGAGNLHELFDIELVEHLGTDPQHIASYLDLAHFPHLKVAGMVARDGRGVGNAVV